MEYKAELPLGIAVSFMKSNDLSIEHTPFYNEDAFVYKDLSGFLRNKLALDAIQNARVQESDVRIASIALHNIEVLISRSQLSA